MEFTNPQKSCTFAPDLKTMKMEELTIIEQLSQLRITASSQMGRRPQGAGPDAVPYH